MTILWAVNHPAPLVWLVVEANKFCYANLGHTTVSAQCRTNIRGKSEAFYTSTDSSLFFTIHCMLGTAIFKGLTIPLLFFSPFIVFVGWMVYVHPIKFPFHLVLGAPPPILDISGNIFLWFIDSPGFKIVKSLSITLVGFTYFYIGAGLGYVTSSSLKCWKDRSFVFIYLRQTSCYCKNFSIIVICIGPLFCCYLVVVLLSSILK